MREHCKRNITIIINRRKFKLVPNYCRRNWRRWSPADM